MSLDYQLGAIKDWKTVCFEKHGTPESRMNPITHSIIFATMAVDVGQITAKNADDFFERLDLIQREAGGLLFEPDRSPYWITRENVRAHIGLRTNVPDMPRKRWNKKQEDIRRRELAREVAR
jgi:hypothetical protein